jgi:spore maturation protein CgeB
VRKFYQELYRSKLCFSPFGYGEICWRDYEAMMSGSLLIKPDVSHLVTEPDIFVQFETYVPVAWNFEDLAEKANYYLDHDIERARIAENAYQAIHKYVSEQRFIEFSKQLFGI